MQLPFIKASGCGNSYIFFDCRRLNCSGTFMSRCAARVSDRNYGIGSDGAVFLCGDNSAFCRMRMFNSDGSEGTVCGNALRCIGLIFKDKLPFAVRTGAGLRWVYRGSGGIFVRMGAPRVQKRLQYVISGRVNDAYVTNAGNTHLVSINADKRAQAYFLRYAESSDINYMALTALSKNSFSMTCHERGSGYTLSCGSGACAAAAAVVYTGAADRSDAVQLVCDGGLLTVTFDKNDAVLGGETHIVCRGMYEI